MNIELSTLIEISKLFIPVIAITGIYIAWQQFTANREKLRFDLFDKRFKIHEDIVGYLDELLFDDENLPNDKYLAFLRACNEAQFIFPDNIYEVVRETKATVTELRRIECQLKRANRKEEPEENIAILRTTIVGLEEKLEKIQPKITESFSEVLKFEKF